MFLNISSKRNLKDQNGFTLVELLVVVLIISILAGIVLTVLNSQGLRQKARDSQRQADLRKIQTALELYFADNRSYPNTGGWINVTGSDAMSSALTSGGYMSNIPDDPGETVSSQATPCASDTNPRYNYYTPDGSYYYLTAIMETPTANDGHECTGLNSWGSNGCGSGNEDICYGTENP